MAGAPGTVSGGCLEAEVAKRAWWLTRIGPVVERYSTLEDDGDLPYGSGCGGVVYILLERRKTASPLLHALKAAFDARMPLAIATVLEGPHIGERAFATLGATATAAMIELDRLRTSSFRNLARSSARSPRLARAEDSDRRRTNSCLGGLSRRAPGLWIFGAGDDAKPLLRLARELGWFVAVADGRSHLATQRSVRSRR